MTPEAAGVELEEGTEEGERLTLKEEIRLREMRRRRRKQH